jgi:hypothetical protein
MVVAAQELGISPTSAVNRPISQSIIDSGSLIVDSLWIADF